MYTKVFLLKKSIKKFFKLSSILEKTLQVEKIRSCIALSWHRTEIKIFGESMHVVVFG